MFFPVRWIIDPSPKQEKKARALKVLYNIGISATFSPHELGISESGITQEINVGVNHPTTLNHIYF